MGSKYSLNVINDKWIPVPGLYNNSVERISLREAIENADSIQDIGVGKYSYIEKFTTKLFPTVLIGDILYQAEKRNGADEFSERKRAKYYRKGKFDMDLFDEYIEQKVKEGVCFDVFDDKNPFLQTPYTEETVKIFAKEKDCERNVGYFVGQNVYKTTNKSFFFGGIEVPAESVENQFSMSREDYLISLIRAGFYFTTLGRGYVPGKLTPFSSICIMPRGKNLFETIMLSIPACKELDYEPPIWERKEYERNTSKTGLHWIPNSFIHNLFIRYKDFDEHGNVKTIYCKFMKVDEEQKNGRDLIRKYPYFITGKKETKKEIIFSVPLLEAGQSPFFIVQRAITDDKEHTYRYNLLDDSGWLDTGSDNIDLDVYTMCSDNSKWVSQSNQIITIPKSMVPKLATADTATDKNQEAIMSYSKQADKLCGILFYAVCSAFLPADKRYGELKGTDPLKKKIDEVTKTCQRQLLDVAEREYPNFLVEIHDITEELKRIVKELEQLKHDIGADFEESAAYKEKAKERAEKISKFNKRIFGELKKYAREVYSENVRRKPSNSIGYWTGLNML